MGAAWYGETASGRWTEKEKRLHINELELLAALYGLKSFASNLRNVRVLCTIDNQTAIAYINKMGGTQFPRLSIIAKQIWAWCEKRDNFIFASYIKSSDNTEADKASREHSEINWKLNPIVFQSIIERYGRPEIDLFASRLNNKCDCFVSWHQDPESFAVDAFTLHWKRWFFYAFPPFSLILRVLRKIISDLAEGILIVPLWPSHPWYPLFTGLLTQPPLIFKPINDLMLSSDSAQHPLSQQLTLVAGHLSGRLSV